MPSSPPAARRRRALTAAWRAAACLAAAAIVHTAPLQAQGAITSGDVPSAAGFSPGARTVVHEDWTNAPGGFLPKSIAVVGGSMSIVEERGRKFLRVNDDASFDLVLPAILPEEYTIEFDMLVPRGTGYAVEIRPATPGEPAGYAGLSRRARNPVVTCGPIGAGVYGASLDATRRFDDALAKALVPCQVAVSAQGVRVFFAGEDAATVPDVSLGRTSRIRFHVPAMSGQEALIGPIRVSSNAGVAAPPTIASGATQPPVPAASGSDGANGAPAPSATVTQSSGTPTPMDAGAQPGARIPGETVVASGTPAPTSATTPGTASSGSRVPGQTIGSMGTTTVTRTPASAAAALRAQQKTVAQAALAIAQEYGLALADVVKALAGGGYALDAIAAFLKADHQGTVESVAKMLHETGVIASGAIVDVLWTTFIDVAKQEAGPLAERLVKTARVELGAAASDVLAAIARKQPRTQRDWAALLLLCGYKAHEVAEALRMTIAPDESQVAAALRGQVSVEELALALSSSFNTGAEGLVKLLSTSVPGLAAVPPGAIATALGEVYKLAEPAAIAAMHAGGIPADGLVAAMKVAYSSTPAQIVARLRGTIASEELARAVQQAFPPATADVLVQAFKLAGAAADEIAPAVRAAYALDEKALAQALTKASFDPTTVAGAMRQAFSSIKPEAVAVALAAAGVPPGPIATALVEAFELAATTVASLLAGLGIQ